jgi:hypothetical protein
MLRRIGQALVCIGTVGFLGTFCLPFAGSWLDSVELPIFFETSTIALPDGGRLTATMPTQRVQHYDGDGHFRNGWFVPAKGGHFAIGLTNDGKVAICSARGREFFLFDLDGRLLGQQPCFSAPREIPPIMQPADFPATNLAPVSPAARPNASLVAILLVPFWHPFVAWAIGLIGVLLSRAGRPTAPQST